MILRKIIIDNSVRYVPKSEQTKERVSKPKTTKASSIPLKQNQKIHKTIKTFLIMFQHQDSNISQNSIYISIRIIIFLFVYD